MERPVVVFEDDCAGKLYPLTLTRPVFDLRCGILSLAEKIGRHLLASRRGPGLRFHERAYLQSRDREEVTSYSDLARGRDAVTFVNARLVFREEILRAIDLGWAGKYVASGVVAIANVPAERAGRFDRYLGRMIEDEAFADLPTRELAAVVVEYPWDLVRHNCEEIKRDFNLAQGDTIRAGLFPGAHFINEGAIRVASEVGIGPGAVIDASEGPVNIERGANVMANASVRGPVHIGAGCVVRMGSSIYGGTTLGPVCKVGGEVAETIVQGYSNKQHGGFLGHSYVGEWVNIGAGTNTSDMKNNYSTVRVPIGGRVVDSGELFVGLFMGDHSKSGIGTIFNSGTAVGVCCNVFGADYPPKGIPSFVWGGSSGFVEHKFEAAVETARRVVERRGRELGEGVEAVLQTVFEQTREERSAFIAK